MNRIAWLFWCVFAANLSRGVAVTATEICQGATLYGSTKGLEGQLVFLVTRLPQGSAASVISYDFLTGITTNLWNAPCRGQLVVSQDGKWIGLIAYGRDRLGFPVPPTQLVMFCPQTHQTRELRFPWYDDVEAVIIGHHAFVQSGSGANLRIDGFDLRNDMTSQFPVAVHTPSGPGQYRLALKRNAGRLFFRFDPGGPRGDPNYAGGEYSYDAASGKTEKVADGRIGCETSVTGELISWESYRWGWALVARSGLEPNVNVRVIRRFVGEAYNFKQLSPCSRYALMERTWVGMRSGRAEMGADYRLCDVRSGRIRTFMKCGTSWENGGGFVAQVHWIRGPSKENGGGIGGHVAICNRSAPAERTDVRTEVK